MVENNFMPIPTLSQSDIDRFWSKVAFTANQDRCWNWTSGKRRRGYGRFTVQIETNKDFGFVANRISYFIANGQCPTDKIVCHLCDNPSCVNPKHLFLGTNQDNTLDMMSKDRGKQQFKNGIQHFNNKLSEDNVREIRIRRSSGESQWSIAKSFNVDQALISRIVNFRLWKHVR